MICYEQTKTNGILFNFGGLVLNMKWTTGKWHEWGFDFESYIEKDRFDALNERASEQTGVSFSTQ